MGDAMPRRRSAPRLYLDPGRGQWVIRDGASFLRTGFGEGDLRKAEAGLANYLAAKHKPERGANPLIVDVLSIYAIERSQFTRTARDTAYNLSALLTGWGTARVADITAER